ncbi:Asp/Glu/hydantoin racemase [Rhodobacteraceae bacterium 2CG4]|uniref:Asp/Glu/hydantoin racemase n=1 Tax=Halovulum marinum TaxID=2662447 RepID=A0A6L5Z431_9RHOB|nr:aspartate/glutamate racemase family protein [Halovulum marinum]MSU90845.1 Asp/Glu/hydantoin racemase [Halovulum marinum]
MMDRKLMGVLTPSSNTILEPGTSALVADLPGVSAHFSRFNVVKIALDEGANNQFLLEPMLVAARLLSDAKVGVIAWSGTSASWLGPDWDAELCAAIEAETGTPACTAVGAINELLARHGASKIGLVTPYTADVQAQIIATYAGQGISVVGEEHLNLSDNFAFSTVSDNDIRAMCRSAARDGAQAIVIMCTNMRGWSFMAELEAQIGIPVIDSTAAVVWKALLVLGEDPVPLEQRGWMFTQAGTA